jgi:hypothetical protein
MQQSKGEGCLGEKPAVTVVIIADYAVGSAQAWDQVRAVWEALQDQDFDEPVEYLVAAFDDQRGKVPREITSLSPELRVFYGTSQNSYTLKNEAVAAASSELVAILDADCRPDPDWLGLCVAALRQDPDAAAVSGRTEYPRDTFAGRAMGLLERSYIEAGGTETRHIANNGAGFRRSVYLQHLLPVDHGIFASKEQSEAMRRAGHRLLFEPRMRVVHEFDDAFDRDHRAGVGYGTIYMRRHNRSLPGAWASRLGYFSVPLFLAARFSKSCLYAFRFHARYGVHWYELPAVIVLAVRGSLREIRGMVRAVHDQPPPPTGFR